MALVQASAPDNIDQQQPTLPSANAWSAWQRHDNATGLQSMTARAQLLDAYMHRQQHNWAAGTLASAGTRRRSDWLEIGLILFAISALEYEQNPRILGFRKLESWRRSTRETFHRQIQFFQQQLKIFLTIRSKVSKQDECWKWYMESAKADHQWGATDVVFSFSEDTPMYDLRKALFRASWNSPRLIITNDTLAHGFDLDVAHRSLHAAGC